MFVCPPPTTPTPPTNFPSLFRSRSKVLSRWLAGLPQQLALLGLRNPELSNQLIDIIHSAASRSNKELLQSLQATAARIYGKLLCYSMMSVVCCLAGKLR